MKSDDTSALRAFQSQVHPARVNFHVYMHPSAIATITTRPVVPASAAAQSFPRLLCCASSFLVFSFGSPY